MCGICGIVSFEHHGSSRDLVHRMCDSIAHRGPDGTGVFEEGPVALGHNRLSIIDLSAAASQPMVSDHTVIAFNGEIYNYEALRLDLPEREFKSRSDTEVFLRAFEKWGVDCFRRLRGMFAAALWNRQSQELTLVRDHFGIKPLYVASTRTGLAFASEVKALLLHEEISRSVDHQALAEFLAYGNALGERTLFSSISKVLPGEYLIISATGIRRERYWTPPHREANNTTVSTGPSFSEAEARTEQLLRSAVRSQLVSDVPVGVLLSGGLDSSLITAFAIDDDPRRIKTFALGFEFSPSQSELPKAKAVATHLGTDHQELIVREKDLAQTVLNCAAAHDEPFADAANIPLYLASHELKKHVTVVLQGDGGDELFGGYRRYKWLRFLGQYPVSRAAFALAGSSAKVLGIKGAARFFSVLGLRDDATRMAHLLIADPLDEQLAGIFGSTARAQLGDYLQEYRAANTRYQREELSQRMLLTDSTVLLPNTFLEKVDKPTMQHAIEVRVPFLDVDLAEYVMRLPTSIKLQRYESKALLRAIAARHLPSQISAQRKQGFEVPYRQWLKGPLRDLFHSAVTENRALGIDRPTLVRLYSEYQSGARNDRGFMLWKLLQLGIWTSRYQTAIGS